jgi:hypothetical protein
MNQEYEFADITPLIISFSNGKDWYHPYINDYYKPDQEDGYDYSVYRVYYENSRGQMLRVYFKSNYIDRKQEEWSKTGIWDSDNEADWPDNKILFEKPFIDPSTVSSCLDVTLLDDVWGPTHPSGGFPKRTAPEWNKWLNDTVMGTNQFCFSKTGQRVSRFFKHDSKITFFSLDCALTTDGKTWWCDS